jgi:hypothetical protein
MEVRQGRQGRTSFLKKRSKKLFVYWGLWRQPRQRPQLIKIFCFPGRGAVFLEEKLLLALAKDGGLRFAYPPYGQWA